MSNNYPGNHYQANQNYSGNQNCSGNQNYSGNGGQDQKQYQQQQYQQQQYQQQQYQPQQYQPQQYQPQQYQTQNQQPHYQESPYPPPYQQHQQNQQPQQNQLNQQNQHQHQQPQCLYQPPQAQCASQYDQYYIQPNQQQFQHPQNPPFGHPFGHYSDTSRSYQPPPGPSAASCVGQSPSPTLPAHPAQPYQSYPSSNMLQNNVHDSKTTGYVDAAPTQKVSEVMMNADELAQAVEMLHRAFKGFVSDKETIIFVLSKTTNNQNQQICGAYETAYARDLVGMIKKETSGHFEDLLVSLLIPASDLAAHAIHEAITGLSADNALLIEVIAHMSVAELLAMKISYRRLYDREVIMQVADDVSGDVKKLIVSLLHGLRQFSDPSTVENDIITLFKDRSVDTFIKIISTRSFDSLKAIFTGFDAVHGTSIFNLVHEMFKGVMEAMVAAFCDMVINTDLTAGYKYASLPSNKNPTIH